MMYRSQMGAAQPTDIFIPRTDNDRHLDHCRCHCRQHCTTHQPVVNKPILILIGCISLFFAALIYLFTQISRDEMGVYSTLIANIPAVLHHPAVHPLGAMEKNQCIRCLHIVRSPRKDSQPPYASSLIWWHFSLESPFSALQEPWTYMVNGIGYIVGLSSSGHRAL